MIPKSSSKWIVLETDKTIDIPEVHNYARTFSVGGRRKKVKKSKRLLNLLYLVFNLNVRRQSPTNKTTDVPEVPNYGRTFSKGKKSTTKIRDCWTCYTLFLTQMLGDITSHDSDMSFVIFRLIRFSTHPLFVGANGN